MKEEARPVAVLCAAAHSAYSQIPGVLVYDRKRNARSFAGHMPVIAHPPCRSWSARCGHQAKPEAGEKELGLWCVEQVRREGGVLEQPANSRLWEAAGLPKPGRSGNEAGWAVEIAQAWWGFPTEKPTWLWFNRICRSLVQYPLVLRMTTGDHRRWQLMSHAQRSRTTALMAEWLVNCARFVPPEKRE